MMAPRVKTLALFVAGTVGQLAAAAEWSNLTLYHVNEKKFAPLGITNMNEGDAAGDMFFAIKSRALPVECPGAYDCRDPEMCKLQLASSRSDPSSVPHDH